MKFSIYIDKRRGAPYAVCVVLRDGSKTRVISTGMKTNTDFNGVAFPPSESNFTVKTIRLAEIYRCVESWILKNTGSGIDEAADAVRMIITPNAKPKMAKTLSHYCVAYSETVGNTGSAAFGLDIATGSHQVHSFAKWSYKKVEIEGFRPPLQTYFCRKPNRRPKFYLYLCAGCGTGIRCHGNHLLRQPPHTFITCKQIIENISHEEDAFSGPVADAGGRLRQERRPRHARGQQRVCGRDRELLHS